jgi:hypothetical protein
LLPPRNEFPNLDAPNDEALKDELCPNRELLNPERPAAELPLNRDDAKLEADRFEPPADRATRPDPVPAPDEDRPANSLPLLPPKECHCPSAMAALAL